MLGVDPGIGGDLKVILLVTFVDWAKKKILWRTNEWTDIGHWTSDTVWTDRCVGRNSDVDMVNIIQPATQVPPYKGSGLLQILVAVFVHSEVVSLKTQVESSDSIQSDQFPFFAVQVTFLESWIWVSSIKKWTKVLEIIWSSCLNTFWFFYLYMLW